MFIHDNFGLKTSIFRTNERNKTTHTGNSTKKHHFAILSPNVSSFYVLFALGSIDETTEQ